MPSRFPVPFDVFSLAGPQRNCEEGMYKSNFQASLPFALSLQNMRICEYKMTEISQFKAEFFKALAHPLRIRILDELRKGEVGVNDLCSRLDVEQSNLSQQLAVLRTRNILATRKDGANVYYSVRDPQLFDLLDVAKKIFNNHLIDIKDLLSQLVVTRRG